MSSVSVTIGSDQYLKNRLALLAAIVRKRGKRHFAGPTEDELRQAMDLSVEDFDKALRGLLYDRDHGSCVVHRFSQEGSSGPLTHRYSPADNLKITVDW